MPKKSKLVPTTFSDLPRSGDLVVQTRVYPGGSKVKVKIRDYVKHSDRVQAICSSARAFDRSSGSVSWEVLPERPSLPAETGSLILVTKVSRAAAEELGTRKTLAVPAWAVLDGDGAWFVGGPTTGVFVEPDEIKAWENPLLATATAQTVSKVHESSECDCCGDGEDESPVRR